MQTAAMLASWNEMALPRFEYCAFSNPACSAISWVIPKNEGCRSGYRRPSGTGPRGYPAAGLGLILDSTAAVTAERRGKNARQLLESVALEIGDEGIAVSVVTVLELAHGKQPCSA